MKRRRGTKMTPPQQPLCFVMLITTACILSAVAQTVDLDYSTVDAAFTDTTLESGKYRTAMRLACVWVTVFQQ